jgi:diaminohydroxyphosphoribosylaminopyrimidine deaminase/5-amino-6-(5-phosphoribosylamino)uracil reductase
MIPDEVYMRRALDLALLGMGCVSPNPGVGCVVVHDDKIIGEGWHRKSGEAHAEVNAIESVKDQSLLKDSTLYVNLEPCSHFGRTPPCADFIIKHALKKVVIGVEDPNPKVNGAGTAKLKAAGIEVKTNVLGESCKSINRRFFTFITKKRAFILLKWAETADGFIARENHQSKWISSELSRMMVHRWRAEEDAILVGSNTAMFDDPNLNVRDWTGRHPKRIVIDRNLKLHNGLHLFDRQQPTLCYNLLKSENGHNLEFIKLSQANFVQELMADLYNRGVQSVMVEGGSKTLQLFINEGLWDEARVFTSGTLTFGKGLPAPVLRGLLIQSVTVETDELNIYHHEENKY